MVKIGKLFVLEGPDGSGKSTLAEALFRYFSSARIPCELRSFPGGEERTLGRLVYNLHHNSSRYGLRSINPTSLQVLHVAAHIDLIERCIIPAITAGKQVILDRFWWSTWVYGRIFGVSLASLEAMKHLELIHWDDIHPAVVFLIRRSTPIRRQEPLERWKKLCVEYRELAEREGRDYRVSIIDNEHSVPESLEKMLVIVNDIEDTRD
jgi:dTMP kinase